jgi:hypothetical protein
MTAQNLIRLRNGKDLILFDRIERMYVGFKLNSNEKMICWKRLVSKDKRNWIVWNEYLSLKEVDAIITELKTKTEKMNLSIVII